MPLDMLYIHPRLDQIDIIDMLIKGQRQKLSFLIYLHLKTK